MEDSAGRAARLGAGVTAFLRLGWLGRRRVVAYSIILALASAASMFWLFRQAMGPQGSDFLAFWSAGRLAVQGQAAAAYDPVALGAIQAEVGRHDVFAFVNPPPLLLGIWPLGLLDYPAAWIVWVGTTYALWVWATWRIFPRLGWPIAGFPGALVAAWHAQTGFLTGALQAGAAGMLEKKPFRAGLCVGALIVKPHLAVLFPVALVAGRQWRAIAGAAVSVIVLISMAWLMFGSATLRAYPQAWAVSDYLLRTGLDDFFLRQTTVYAMVRVLAGSGSAALAQGAATLGSAWLIWCAWSRTTLLPGRQNLSAERQHSLSGKLALLFAATPLATPYLFSYDLPFLAIPVCWLATVSRPDDLKGWIRPVLVLIYLSPLATRAMALPVGINPMPLVSAAMVWLTWRALAAGR